VVNDSSADLGPSAFFDLTDPTVAALFKDVAYVWDVLRQIPELVRGLLREAQDSSDQGGLTREDDVHISPGARIEPDVYIQGPTFIGPGVAIRHGAYVRGNCILLDGAVLGHASEMKNSILLPKAKAPHFSYVGDSVLGSRSNLESYRKLGSLPASPQVSGVMARVSDKTPWSRDEVEQCSDYYDFGPSAVNHN